MYQHEHPLAPSLACSVLEIDERNAKYPERYCLSLDILTAYPYIYFQTSKAISFSCPPCSSLEIAVIPYQSSTLRQRRLSYTSSLQHIHLPSRPPSFEPAHVTCELWIQHWKPAIFNTSVHSPSKHRHPRPSPCKLITLPTSLHNQCKPYHPQDTPSTCPQPWNYSS